MAAAVGGTLFAVSGGSGGTPSTGAPSGTAVPPTSAGGPAGAPDPADVAAARACQAWNDYLTAALAGKITPEVGQRLIRAAEALLPAQGAQRTEETLPKWAQLGAALLSAADDVVNKDTKALAGDAADVADQCRTIPAAAAAAGGFTNTAPPSASP